MYKKWTELATFREKRTITREFMEQKIRNIVSDYSYKETGGGITTPKITRGLKLKKIKIDERTVRRYLASLRAEGLVAKRKEIGHKWKYYVTRIYLESQPYFVYQMRRVGWRMIYPIWLTPELIGSAQKSHIPTYDSTLNIDRHLDAKGKIIRGPTPAESLHLHDKYSSMIYGKTEPQHEFYESMSRNDITISNKFCQTKFGRAEKERQMFEFVNRVGAFITYVFLKSLEASRKNEKSNSKSTIDNAIDLQSFFKEFCHLFQMPSYIGLKEEHLQEISKAFRNVYPVGNILEKYWLDTVELSTSFKNDMEAGRIK
jgi:hypothetical protein